MKRAVIVGNNEYPNAPGNGLIGCVPDLQHVRAFLTDKFIDQFYSILPLANATKAQEMAALTAMCQAAKPGDYLLWSHSSHGGLQDDGTPFIACSDIRELGNGWDPKTIITHEEVHTLIAGLPAGVIMEFLLDACFSDGMERLLGKTYSKSKFIAHSQGGPTEPKGLLPQPSNGILFAACQGNETAADGGNSGGVFTTAFISCYKPELSRKDLMATIVQQIHKESYPQTPALDCSDGLAGLPFGSF